MYFTCKHCNGIILVSYNEMICQKCGKKILFLNDEKQQYTKKIDLENLDVNLFSQILFG